MQDYFQWRKIKLIEYCMNGILWGVPILICTVNFLYAAYVMNISFLILFKKLPALLLITFVTVAAILIIVGFLIFPANSYKVNLVSEWYKLLKSQEDYIKHSKHFTDEEIDNIFYSFGWK